MTTSATTTPTGSTPQVRKKAGINRWDSPWLNGKFIAGICMVGSIMLMGIVGQMFWPPELSYPASSPLNLPPPWAPGFDQSVQIKAPVLTALPTRRPTAVPTAAAGAAAEEAAPAAASITGGNPFQQAGTPAAAPEGGQSGAASITGGNPLQKATPAAAQQSGSVTGGNPLQQKATPQAPAADVPDKPVGAAAAARFGQPSWEHPLGTESNGRDMLAVLLVGAPRSLYIGLIAATIGMIIGILLGFTAGYMGGWVDSFIRTISDAVVVIPALAVLIVIGAYVKVLSIENMALLLALFAWPAPTRFIRAQVLSMRERGYVNMARISGASSFDILFKEMMPNMLPYIAASYTGNVSGAILAATSLEVLGLGPTRIPTLGMTIFYAIRAAAILRGMWWWWGIPIVALIVVFTGLFLMTTGLDEIANPRLRGRKATA